MKVCSALLATVLLASSTAFAVPISGTAGSGGPVVPGATSVINFDSQSNSSFSSTTLGGVTFSGLAGDLRFDDEYAGEYNSRGSHHLDNDAGGTLGFRFDFSAPVDAFAFNWGAADEDWVLRAFDSVGNLIESYALPPTYASNDGQYYGLAASNIAYATLVTDASYDWVFIDNFTVAGEPRSDVPEPGTTALLGLGLLGVLAARRKPGRPA